MFSPLLTRENSAFIPTVTAQVLSTTMASADFSAHRNRIYSKTSPGKRIFLPPIPTASTKKKLLVRGVDIMCCLTRSS